MADLFPVAMEIPQASLAGVGLLPVSALSSSLVPDVVDLQCNVISFSHSHSPILPFSHSPILTVIVTAIYTAVTAHIP